MINSKSVYSRFSWRNALLVGLVMLSCIMALAGCDANDAEETGLSPDLAAPSVSAAKFATVVGWPEAQSPTAPEGFVVQRFADGLVSPRWPYVLPNGDVLIAEASTLPDRDTSKAETQQLRKAGNIQRNANRITLLRDANGDGKPELRKVFLNNLNQPFGMALVADDFFVANTNALLKFTYKRGQTHIEDKGEKILDLPAGGYNNHWTRNVVASRDGEKLYVSVGSATNVDEEHIDIKDGRRAAILEINPDGTGLGLLANGLRNPNGMDWAPGTTSLWAVVNERDELGDELVPDYLTDVHRNAFFGWPYAYFGEHEDPRHEGERPDLVRRAVEPDYALGAHTASLGLQFYMGKTFPKDYWGDALIAQHGSWNRSQLVGYKVLTVPFEDGAPVGPPEDFLTGFIADEAKGEVYGRPVGLAVMNDGSLLVTDDAAGVVWRIAPIDAQASENAVVDGLESPESAIQFDDGTTYVSEMGETQEAGDGGIAVITPNGEVKTFVDGLDDPKGLVWWGDWLYVADVQGIWRIDRYRHPVLMVGLEDFPEKPRLLNDLTVTLDGTLYVSDTGNSKHAGAVYKVDQSGAVKNVFAKRQPPPFQNPNGLLIEGNQNQGKQSMLVADAEAGTLYRVGLADGEVTLIAEGLGAADGIVKTVSGPIYVSDYKNGNIFQIDGQINGKKQVRRLNASRRFGGAADISLSSIGSYLLVPDIRAGELTFLPVRQETSAHETTRDAPSRQSVERVEAVSSRKTLEP